MIRRAVWAVLFIFVTGGCAYFNTMYHARKYFRDAEEERADAPEGTLPASAAQLYDKSATKCAKVIQRHPGSRWVDDALLLMARCFYEREEYERSLKVLDELRAKFPQSDLIDDASYYTGLVYWKMGKDAEARPYLEKEIARKDGDRKRRHEAWLVLGRSQLSAGETKEAAATFRDLLNQKDLAKDRRSEVKFWLGEALVKAGEVDQGLVILREATKETVDEKLLRSFEVRVGEVLEEQERFAEAATLFHGIAEREADPVRKRQLQLREAESMQRSGDTDSALGLLDELVSEDPKGQEGAQAQFQIGLIYQNDLRDYDRALEEYDKLKENAPGATATRDAAEERRKILALQRYEKEIAALDSTRAETKAKTHFLFAESLLLDFDDVDRALEQYEACARTDSTGEYAARALLSASWILAEDPSRRAEARERLEQLIHEYPDTPQAARAENLLQGLEGQENP
jgi:TolA-binding protein